LALRVGDEVESGLALAMVLAIGGNGIGTGVGDGMGTTDDRWLLSRAGVRDGDRTGGVGMR